MGNSRGRVPGRRSAGRLAGVAVAVSLAFGGVSGCNFVGDKSIPATAATVEGIEVSSKTVEELFEIFRATEAGKEKDQSGSGGALVSDRVIRQTALSYQIKITFLEALAKKEGVSIDESPDNESRFDDLVTAPSLQGQGVRSKDLAIAARAEKLQKAIAQKLLPNVEVNDTELEEAYEQRKEALGESFKAQTDIAFMNTKEAAEELIQKAKDGATFVDTANGLDKLLVDTVTINPLSPISGDFIAKVKDLKQGEVSEPLEFTVDDGTLYVVLHVEKREDLKALSLKDKEVRDELSDVVRNSKRFRFFEQWFSKRFREADIDVDGYYGKWKPSSLAVT